jgi:signal transduction histidine kinase
VSHELRNPIAVVVGLGEELANNYESFTDMQRRDIAHLIARQADEAGWLIEDLLVAYRDDLDQLRVTPETFDVIKEIERVLEVVDYPIATPTYEGSTSVYADPGRTRQILRNLVSNAIRYGGDKIEMRLARVGDRIEIGVSDSGGPISEADVERIFRPYEQGSGPQHPKSVGLGLTVARRLARLMDGDLVYRYESGWSNFVLSLPSA